MSISFHLYTGESRFTRLSFHLNFLFILSFLMKWDSKGLYPKWISYSKNTFQFHYSHHYVLGTTWICKIFKVGLRYLLPGWMRLCRFRHKMIYSEVAVDKHWYYYSTYNNLLSWKKPLEMVIKAVPQKTAIWPAVQGSKERMLITPVTGTWSLFTLATILHKKVRDKCLQW